MSEKRAIFESEWPMTKVKLESGEADAATWKGAHERLLKARLDDRYLKPIKSIRESGSYIGEGFAILTIQCGLIEFLAALRCGWNYRNGAAYGKNNEYGSSRRLYAEFLTNQKPFSDYVPDSERALEFYRDVRCGLTHEAQTKNGWKVRAANATDSAIDFNSKFVNRDLLGNAIDKYLAIYSDELQTSADLQAAFVRKLQHIHEHSISAMSDHPLKATP